MVMIVAMTTVMGTTMTTAITTATGTFMPMPRTNGACFWRWF